MNTAASVVSRTQTSLPRILVVDDESEFRELASELLAARVPCRMTLASNLADARRLIERQEIDLVVLDLHLPDGDGLQLLPVLLKRRPDARVVLVSGQPENCETLKLALRSGVLDYLGKPFDLDTAAEVLRRALRLQQAAARDRRRLARLRSAVKALNQARKTVSKKVDLLCNDLISAYSDLARQMEQVRTQENFRLTLDSAADLEQMLCHVMDWMLRKFGYSNIAIYLVGDEQQYELGAYMKYTLPGTRPLTDAVREGLLRKVIRDELIRANGADVHGLLTPDERKHLAGQTVMGASCSYLGESLAGVVLFRDSKTPFTKEHEQMLRDIAPIFATALASLIKRHPEDDSGFDPRDSDDFGPDLFDSEADEPDSIENPPPNPRRKKPRKRDNSTDADWWKRGEPPPFER